MDISTIPAEMWMSQGLFALLFVWLLFDTRKESKAREDKLISQIEKQNESQEKIVLSLERLEHQISTIKQVQ
ncbi:BhlA/UviB family holin-like peptide [Bacillus sp. JJ722]|uniref:BhlA/UviB family holin-like peptide n=1 Tax=Bacillus sp. JJ722 TaxID=3122973 RepID=UPI003000BFA0